jgi:hypothetical protein
MAKREYINSAMGLYGVGSPSGNLYTNAQSKAKRADKKSQQAENCEKPIGMKNAEDFLYACGAFGDVKYSAEGDDLDKEIDNEDNFDFFPLKNPDTGKLVDLVKNEGLYSLIDGKIQFYKDKNTHDTPKTGNKGLCSYSIGDTIGYVQDWGEGNKAVSYRKYVDVSNETGANLNKKIGRDANHIKRETSDIAVMRKVDANGNMTNVPYTTIKGLKKFERVCNKLTSGLYAKTKFSVQALVGLGKWALSKDERKKVDEYNKARKELSDNRDTIVKYLDDIKNKQIDLAKQAGDPKKDVNKSGMFWNGIMNEFVAKNMNTFIGYYTDGVKLKNYLDSKCKKPTSTTAAYKDVITRLYSSSQWFRNYYTFNNVSYGVVQVVNDTAREIYNSTKEKEGQKGDSEFGLTKAVWDKVPTNGSNVSIFAVGIAYWLQQLGEKGFESVTDENSEEYYKNCVKVCSYAFHGLYLQPLETWTKSTESTENTAFVRKEVVDELIGKGYNLANLKTLADGVHDVDGNAFYTNVIISYRWANSLSTYENYPVFDTDYTLMQIEGIYDKCHAINERNLVLEKTINNLVKNSKYIESKNAFCVNVIQNGKDKFKELKDKFDESSPYRRAVKRGRELKRELLPLREQGANLEADMEKIEVNMTKIKQDIETYQLILDDESIDQTARDKADKMLDKLTDDLDGWITKQENKIAEHDKLDEEKIKPRETEFETLGTIVTKVMDIYGSYKRKDARMTYRIKKREVKDELKKLYGKYWRKEGNWKDIKIEFKVERNKVLQEYQSIFGKIAHGALAFVLMPARNIVTVLLMLNIGGMTTRLEQMKNVHDGNGKTSDEIKVRNLYELILQRWYSIGGKREFLDKIIAKYGKAKPIANKSGEPDEILAENNLNAEEIASMDSDIKLDATGKQYLNFVVSEYIATILGYVKSFFCWLWAFLTQWGSLICKLFGALLGGKDDEPTIGGGMNYDPAEDCAGQLALLESFLATNPDPMPTDEQKQKMTDLICDKGYTFQQAYEEVTGVKLTIKTDANGNTIIVAEGKTALGIGLGVGIGILALGGILWAVLSD